MWGDNMIGRFIALVLWSFILVRIAIRLYVRKGNKDLLNDLENKR